jgi:hypothetical protein
MQRAIFVALNHAIKPLDVWRASKSVGLLSVCATIPIRYVNGDPRSKATTAGLTIVSALAAVYGVPPDQAAEGVVVATPPLDLVRACVERLHAACPGPFSQQWIDRRLREIEAAVAASQKVEADCVPAAREEALSR